MITVGIVGYGYWGPNLVRNFFSVAGCRVKKVADPRPERRECLAKQYPCIEGVADVESVINDLEIDAVVIATPVFTHFRLAHKALLAGKHVLIEKPMASSVRQADILINLARQKNLLLMVDHTFLYTGAIEKIKELTVGNELGTLKYMDSTRINLGLFQQDVNVLWDLAPHDLAILCYLITERPYSINATGITHTASSMESIGYLTVKYQSGFMAHFSCSWTSPVKIRTMLFGGDKKMILYNDLEPTEKVKVYDTGYEYKTDDDRKKLLVDYRTGDIHVPKLKTIEALQSMASNFVECIVHNMEPRSSATIGRDVISLLEASDISIKNNGCEVIINAYGNDSSKLTSAGIEKC